MDHHYIPQFYLRPWLGADHKLQEFRRGYQGRIQTGRYGTKSTGFEIDLYTLPGVTEATKQNVEKVYMGLVDGNAAVVRDMLLDGRIPHDQGLRHTWVRFILSLILRHPEAVAKFKQRYARDFGKSDARLQEKYESLRREHDPPTLEEFVLQLDPTVAERQAVLTLTKLIENERTTTLMRRMHWAVLDTSRYSRKLMTSDRPLVTTNGLGRPDGHMALAIAPNRLFLATTFKSYMDTVQRKPIGRMIRNMNDAVIGQGRKYVYATDATPIAEVRRRMGKRDYLTLLPEPDADIPYPPGWLTEQPVPQRVSASGAVTSSE